MAERVEILGLDKVLKNLKGLEPELKRKALLSGAKAGAGIFKRAIISRAPKKTGALKRGISVAQMSKKLATTSDIVGAMVFIRTSGKRTKKQKMAKEDPWYWYLQEYGYIPSGRWRTRKIGGRKTAGNEGLTLAGFRAKSRKTRKKKPGLSFIKRAFNSNKAKIEASYKNRIAKWVDKYRGR